ncbi:hypothetical protein Sango_3000200 [Sesamum angolense]|uniref:Uncharacterized protein n=1 Tax=Sesamum angolense TaxID=2727404 RepID=A0AAE1T3V7_9LAMI|nr:hypothetical protein Sango_3000200 [Sesamum angolense]
MIEGIKGKGERELAKKRSRLSAASKPSVGWRPERRGSEDKGTGAAPAVRTEAGTERGGASGEAPEREQMHRAGWRGAAERRSKVGSAEFNVQINFNTIGNARNLVNVNPTKSQIILSRAVQQERQQIIDFLGFQEGSLPVKYLGVPLTSSRLTLADCRPLNGHSFGRLESYAGRLQLIRSVLSTLHTYWASVFILPKGILKVIEGKMRKFLWQDQVEGNDGTSIWVNWIQITAFETAPFGHLMVQQVPGAGRKCSN